MGAFPFVCDQFLLFFHFFCAKEQDCGALAACRDFSPNAALGYASSFPPPNYWERDTKTKLHNPVAVQKCSLSPTKPSLAAIPPVDPLALVRLINLGVWAVSCSAPSWLFPNTTVSSPLYSANPKSVLFGKNPGASAASTKYIHCLLSFITPSQQRSGHAPAMGSMVEEKGHLAAPFVALRRSPRSAERPPGSLSPSLFLRCLSC